MKTNRLYEERINNQGCPMKIIEYITNGDITVEFQDEYKAKVHTNYSNFQRGLVKNPYFPTVFDVGVIGVKYPVSINCIHTKEYLAWQSMLQRCYSNKAKEKNPCYKNIKCCKEWLSFENFGDWLHSQPNFNKWLSGRRWAVDKDILTKGNKEYNPYACCLVPQNVNCLFLKREARRGKYPIGVRYNGKGYVAYCRNPFIDDSVELGCYPTIEEAFRVYKIYKEDIIKKVAQNEYSKGNITKECYEAMMNYEVEIDD